MDSKAVKRNRDSVLHRTLVGNITKTPRLSDSPLRLMQILDDRFEKLSDRIEDRMKSLLKESENRIFNELDKSLCELRADIADISDRVTKLETAVCEIDVLKLELKEIKLQVLRQENAPVASDLRINGIPFNENENLNNIFTKTCTSCNIPTPKLKFIHRLRNRNNTKERNSPDGVIIATLMSPYDKNFLLKGLSEFRKRNNTTLSLNLIGFDSTCQFYINENISNSNYRILQDALSLKRKKLLHSAYTFKGLVYVKRDPSDVPRYNGEYDQYIV
ncbi:uncharacterized protein LOC131996316 [Stomoxys calcitrans]|uniref:uncharacterized protein LOC131996316 n=1 Tax=Stomoxys calcitrans TaxID=35570 RepID=UPI0027E33BAD|nr:uncharacterized protein LOC131996316 [Stomoxys calcitrans]